MASENKPPLDAFTPSALDRFVDLLGAVLIPPGDSALYVANTRNGVSASGHGTLWLVGNDGCGSVRFAEFEGAQSKPSVSADGRWVAFRQVEDGRAQICVRGLEGGDTSVLTSFARGVGPIGPAWSPDGRRIAFDGWEAAPRDKALSHRVTRPIWRRDGMGLVEDALSDIYVVPAVGGQPERLTFEDGIIAFHSWSADGSRLLLVVFATPRSSDYEIKIVDYPSGRVHEVTSGPCVEAPAVASWLPDGRVAYTSPASINGPIDLLVFDPETGSNESRAPETNGQLFGRVQPGFRLEPLEPKIVIDPTGANAFVSIQQGGSLVTHKVALAGERRVQPVSDPVRSTLPIDICGHRLLTLQSSFTTPPALHIIDLDAGDTGPLTTLNPSLPGALPFEVRHLSFDAEDATRVEGWYLEPHHGSRPYPTVLHVHGGPFVGHGEMFSVDHQLLTAAGYGVLLINFRGGSGYGDEFASKLIGDWGHHDMADLLQGLDVAIEHGLADAEHVASFGLSGGGYMTAWLLTHSDRFRAGIAECLISDLTGLLAADISNVITMWMGSDPGRGEASMAPYVRMSPATYATGCSTPLLIIEHEDDLRCPPTQGDILYNSLQLAGETVEMLRLPGVPHWPYGADLRIRVERAEAILEWLDRYVR